MRFILAVCSGFARRSATQNAKFKGAKSRTFSTLIQEENLKLQRLQKKLLSALVHELLRSKRHLTFERSLCKKKNRLCLDTRPVRQDGNATQLLSKTKKAAEQTYDATNQRCLAVVGAVLLLPPIWTVINSPFVQITTR